MADNQKLDPRTGFYHMVRGTLLYFKNRSEYRQYMRDLRNA